MAKPPLPDPQWSNAVPICVVCGYSLTGLPTNGQCPECGAHYEAAQLVLAGVPRNSTNTSWQRKVIWAVLMVFGTIHAYTWTLQVFRYPILFLVISAALAGAVIAMLATGPRERRGTERFIIAPSGIARVAANFDPAARRLDTVFIPWGHADAVNLQRISPFWRRLRIGQLSEGLHGPMRNIIFDAGIRCPDKDDDSVRTLIQNYLQNARRLPPSSP
jgi:hypothetical protein